MVQWPYSVVVILPTNRGHLEFGVGQYFKGSLDIGDRQRRIREHIARQIRVVENEEIRPDRRRRIGARFEFLCRRGSGRYQERSGEGMAYDAGRITGALDQRPIVIKRWRIRYCIRVGSWPF